MASKSILFSLLLTLLLCTSLISCDYEEVEDVLSVDFSGSAVRFLHASPNAPRVDIFVNGTLALNIGFSQLSNYTYIPSGLAVVEVFVQQTNTSVLKINAELAEGVGYTAAVTGFVDQLKPVLLQDDVPSQNSSKIRISHFSPDAPAVVFSLKNTVTGGSGSVSLSSGNSSGFIEFPGGYYELTASLLSSPSTILLDRNVNLLANSVSSVFVVGAKSNLTLVTDGGPLQPVTLPPATPEDNSGLSGGAIAAIVICSLIGACIALAVIYYFLNRRRGEYETVP